MKTDDSITWQTFSEEFSRRERGKSFTRACVCDRARSVQKGRKERKRKGESSHFFLPPDVVHVAPLKADGGSSRIRRREGTSKLTFPRARVGKVRGEKDESRMVNTWCKNRSVRICTDLLSAKPRSASASGMYTRESSADYFFLFSFFLYFFFGRFQNSRINELTSMFRERVIAADSPRLISAIALPDVAPIHSTAPTTDETPAPLRRRERTDVLYRSTRWLLRN